MSDQANDLYGDHGLSPLQMKEALTNLERYFELAVEIVRNNTASAEVGVDIPVSDPTMEERSNITLKT